MESDAVMEQECGNSKRVKVKRISRQKCVICGKSISDRRNLVRHMRRVHGEEPIIRKPQLKCSFNDNCKFLCATSETLREHLKKTHNLNVQQITLNFRCRTDFEKWKQEEELNTNARYVLYTGTKCRGTKKMYYLRCHRSGAIRSESNTKVRKRSRPKKGYTQCGTTCPSSITVAENGTGAIQATYYPDHLGHTLDDNSIQYMKLSLKEKEEIAGKLAQGEPIRKIVSDARKMKGSKLSRINLLQRRDVYNIKNKVTYLEKEEDHDGKIIDNWIRGFGLVGMSDGPVVLYCPKGKTNDYTLVLIHHIQKIIYSIAFDGSIVYVKIKNGKPNVDFNLITISVINENGDGYPIAFCLSHKTEYMTLYTFFKIVYQNFGPIKAQIFVSDNVSQIYLAWQTVMGECDNRLMCTFDMETCWEHKLTALKCPINKQNETSSRLRSLLHQTDKDLFEAGLYELLTMWENDEEMRIFGSFFHKYYAKRRYEWATCYRIHSTRKESINHYLEPINRVLDAIYVESYCSLTNSLNYLFTFIRDVCFLQLLKWDENILLEKLDEVHRTHEETSNITEVRSNGLEWVVRDDDSNFVVKTTDSDCDKKCGIFCEACDICTHNYSCVCSDYVTGFNICRHIHAVVIFSAENTACQCTLTKENEDLKDPTGTPSKNSAVLLAEALMVELRKSNLTSEEYKDIVDKMKKLREDIRRKSK